MNVCRVIVAVGESKSAVKSAEFRWHEFQWGSNWWIQWSFRSRWTRSRITVWSQYTHRVPKNATVNKGHHIRRHCAHDLKGVAAVVKV